MDVCTGDSISDLLARSPGLAAFYTGYASYLHRCLETVDLAQLEAVGQVFLRAREEGRTIFFAGNGGSAATASHFCQDLAEVGRKAKVKGFRTLSLTDNVSYITAAGNDYGYHNIFTTQMMFLFQERDVLVVISASGNSPNVVEAARFAKERGGIVIALVGFDGGQLGNMAHHVLKVETHRGEYGPVEDAHLIFDHVITTFLTSRLNAEREPGCQRGVDQ
ncbi:MAG: SIS domain-containing protein [Magnetococcales bacterium]|nr:SIS domain-containing protein [Magnetococcales bacterium]MBF0148891.1 SIS domain-containing protein [Magnetococcales bacterium]MBF0172953.1 SIS domain-containing protein [Magnetococcales bacterium]MBF0347339.1 SIS domain-containing protein [Magnetococcales bacterium]